MQHRLQGHWSSWKLERLRVFYDIKRYLELERTNHSETAKSIVQVVLWELERHDDAHMDFIVRQIVCTSQFVTVSENYGKIAECVIVMGLKTIICGCVLVVDSRTFGNLTGNLSALWTGLTRAGHLSWTLRASVEFVFVGGEASVFQARGSGYQICLAQRDQGRLSCFLGRDVLFDHAVFRQGLSRLVTINPSPTVLSRLSLGGFSSVCCLWVEKTGKVWWN